MSIYIVNGAAGSGKTTFEGNIKEIVGDSCYILSTITPIKEIAKAVGWDGKKDLKSRKFLSDLKDLLTEYNDYSLNYICTEVLRIKGEYYGFDSVPVIFIDCREPKEIKKLCDVLDAKSLLIRRASAENAETSNHADAEVLNYEYDIVIENNGDLRDYAYKAFEFVEQEKLIKRSNHLAVNLFGEIIEE
jgi:hypothetical protein